MITDKLTDRPTDRHTDWHSKLLSRVHATYNRWRLVIFFSYLDFGTKRKNLAQRVKKWWFYEGNLKNDCCEILAISTLKEGSVCHKGAYSAQRGPLAAQRGKLRAWNGQFRGSKGPIWGLRSANSSLEWANMGLRSANLGISWANLRLRLANLGHKGANSGL